MLANKSLLIYVVAGKLENPPGFSGLLGAGAFRNNRPLVLLLHLPLQPPGAKWPLLCHHPIFGLLTAAL